MARPVTISREADDVPVSARPRRPWLSWLILLAAAFLAGLFVMGYALTHWDVAARYLRPASSAAPAAPARIIAPAALSAPAMMIAPSATALDGVDRRVRELEQRIAGVDAQAHAAAGNAERAEGLLIAFAARRALDRGVALGYLEPLLSARFGATQPQAVATVIASAREPVTLDELRGGLAAVGPSLVGRDPQAGWWQGLQRELAAMIVIRRASTPSIAPDDRLARAKSAVESGHVDRALVEVARLPGRDVAADWMAGARRYVAARGALDALETAALLAPRRPAPATGGVPAADGVRVSTEDGDPLRHPLP